MIDLKIKMKRVYILVKLILIFNIVKSYNNPKVIKKYAEKNHKLVPYFAKSYTKTLSHYERRTNTRRIYCMQVEIIMKH